MGEFIFSVAFVGLEIEMVVNSKNKIPMKLGI